MKQALPVAWVIIIWMNMLPLPVFRVAHAMDEDADVTVDVGKLTEGNLIISISTFGRTM